MALTPSNVDARTDSRAGYFFRLQQQLYKQLRVNVRSSSRINAVCSLMMLGHGNQALPIEAGPCQLVRHPKLGLIPICC